MCPLGLLLCRLPAYQAHCEAHVLQNAAAGSKAWEEATKTSLGK